MALSSSVTTIPKTPLDHYAENAEAILCGHNVTCPSLCHFVFHERNRSKYIALTIKAQDIYQSSA